MEEFITGITVTIDETSFKDPERLVKILQLYCSEKKASYYTVRGTFEEVENLSTRLSEVRDRSDPVTRTRTRSQGERASPHVKPVDVSVDVSGVVMVYIQQKRAEQLRKIQGSSFVIETQPEPRTVHHDPSSTVRLTFRSHHASSTPVHFVRQRFVTFYQRTASDLQVESITASPQRDHKDMQKRFPHLLFEPGRNGGKMTVTGPFMHVAKLKEFLSRNTPSLSKSPVDRGPADTASGRTLGSSSAHGKGPKEDPCPICMEPIETTEKKTLRCKHSFCKSCLKRAFDYKPVCPTCGELYGALTGTQPDGGEMKVTKNISSLPGYEKYGTLTIHYYIPSGIQKEEHPSPGQSYEGASRTAYLPDSSEGRRILALLRRAFDQKLIFTVGRSTTSGRNNMVTWNDIHHKTSTHGGPTHYGYPDPEYLSRVQDELKVKGIK
ncbi:E3 ubiquitin-protein ligase DTX3L isoform X2 [Anarhichas minor]|uniref:E3 ubiquitin-protein ligase DTX3L isoform X2 n=1 Tax=Anarhichas minor TaxID=65739 RepID=UPI003F732F4C